MGCCDIYKKDFFQDISDLDSCTVDSSKLVSLIPSYNPLLSGIWRPIFIEASKSNINYVEPFIRARSESVAVNPCNCINAGDTYDEIDVEKTSLDCSYCQDPNSPHSFTWSLTDTSGHKSPNIYASCCSGACDTRTYKDDYLAKLPVLNSTYIDHFHDFKYMRQFPACNNRSLGFEKIFTTRTLNSFSSSPELRCDWKIQERIGEIPPNDMDTYHDTIDVHEQSYNRYLRNNKTAGNFILLKPHANYLTNGGDFPVLSGNIGDIAKTGTYKYLLPEPSKFTMPYGFSNEDHYNIFVKTEKLGSYWKWNYSSGVLCWYRYFDKDIPKDQDKRMIPGVDLYISPGDMFYATNDGPEPLNLQGSSINGNIKTCPSGLKLIKNNVISGVIPSGSEFIYMSTNIYNKCFNILNRLDFLESSLDIPDTKKTSPLNKLKLAALLATGPNFDEVTVDLLKQPKFENISGITYTRNIYNQIDLFESQMLKKPINTANNLNIVKTKIDFINTIANKYGCYLWFPPNSTTSLKLKKELLPAHAYLNLDFEMSINASDIKFAPTDTGTIPKVCRNTPIKKNFSYQQSVQLGDAIFSTSGDARHYNNSCNSGVFTIGNIINTTSAHLNGQLLNHISIASGYTLFNNKYELAPSYESAANAVGGKYKLCDENYLCDAQSAFTVNNNKSLWNTPNQRKVSVFNNEKAFNLTRSYPAIAYSTNIDRLGFHRDGGVYYDSNIFGSGNVVFVQGTTFSDGICEIKFTTKNVGIKLYEFSLNKLRDSTSGNARCPTFPTDQPCKCFPLSRITSHPYNCDGKLIYTNASNILYTPNISTLNSPSLKSYGGYPLSYVTELIGDTRIPNHPAVGSNIPTVDKKIDPLNPYECTKNVSFSLPNYVKTLWNLTLPNLNTNHSDIWVSVSDGSNLLNPSIIVWDDEELTTRNNPNFRRFTTKTTINNLVLWNRQQKTLFDKSNKFEPKINIELLNPFLEAALNNGEEPSETNILYTPLNCTTDVSYNNLDPRLINVGITIKQIPRKHILAFNMDPKIKSMGTLTKSFFHPNSGIVSASNFKDKTSLLFNKDTCTFDFDYERKLFLDSVIYSDSGIMFKGDLNDGVKNFIKVLNQLDNHKKIRLYLKVKNNWYEYLNSNIFGFYNPDKDETYPGYPLLFNYTNDLDYTYGPLIPAQAKKNVQLSYMYNMPNVGATGSISVPHYDDIYTYGPRLYPISTNKFYIDKDSTTKIIVDGSRAYFMVKEADSAIAINSIENISEEDLEKIIENTIIVDDNNKRWKYKGIGDKMTKESYVSLPPRNYYDNNFYESSIDYLKTNKDGYIANTDLKCILTSVKLIDLNDSTIQYDAKIKSKSLYSQLVDEGGKKITIFDSNKQKQYRKIFTVFELDLCSSCEIPLAEGVIDFSMIKSQNPIGVESFVIYDNMGNSLRSEYDSYLAQILYSTKWGDLARFDNKNQYTDILNSRFLYDKINYSYPKVPYQNMYNNLVINDTNTGLINFILTTSDPQKQSTKINISYHGETYFTIHQKYNIGQDISNVDPIYLSSSQQDVNNYLPFLDINFMNLSGIRYNSQASDLISNLKTNFDNHLLSTGNIYFSGIREKMPRSSLPADPIKTSGFFINIDKNALLKPLIFDKTFYHDTLRVDQPYYVLSKYTRKDTESNSTDCTTYYRPNLSVASENIGPYFNIGSLTNPVTGIDGKPFLDLPIYCDSDKLGPCDQLTCSMKTAGYTRLSASYQNYDYKYIKGSDLTNDSVEYYLSFDEGLFNGIGYQSIPYIQRFEIPPYSILNDKNGDNPNYCSSQTKNKPDRPFTYMDKNYQNELNSNVDNDKSTLVSNTDILANEMLFRVLYGEKQKISYDNIKKKTIVDLLTNKNRSVGYLLQYADIRTTPDKIYDLIPYDYSSNSDSSRRKISGNIDIAGVLKLGSKVKVTIGDLTINFEVKNVEGKVKIVAAGGGKTYETIIHHEKTIEERLVAIQKPGAPSPFGDNISYQLIGTCGDNIPRKDWNPFGYISKATVFGYDILAEYAKCEQCRTDPGNCQSFAGNLVSYTYMGFLFCDKHAIGDVYTTQAPCSIINEQSAEVSAGGASRGSTSCSIYATCVAANGYIDLSPAFRVGNFFDMCGGTLVQPLCGGTNCSAAPAPCEGNCYPLSYSNNLGQQVHDPVLAGYRNAGTPCECSNLPEIKYCQIVPNRCSCPQWAEGYPKIFTYQFEDCNYKFNLNGHIYRMKHGEPAKHSGKTSDIGNCNGFVPYEFKADGTATEHWGWTECIFPPPSSYDIYIEKTTTTNPYAPLCPTSLCSISYDNFSVNLSMGSVLGCFDILIKNDCPEITIEVPDNTFTVNDSINSECTTCDVINEKINMTPQNPKWETIIENKIAILGTFAIEGDLNKDAFCAGGTAHLGKGICSVPEPTFCWGDACYDGAGAVGMCGKTGNSAFVWNYGIACDLAGSPGMQFVPCTRGRGAGGLFNIGSQIRLEFGSDNGAVKGAKVAYWKSLMKQAFNDIAICRKSSEGININDLVEGVVPGSCRLKFKVISFPATAWRAGYEGGESTSATIGVHVAYYEYKYKRPKNIYDILIGSNYKKCNEALPSAPNSKHNITEKYKTPDCSNSPSCYDTTVDTCDTQDYCCKTSQRHLSEDF